MEINNSSKMESSYLNYQQLINNYTEADKKYNKFTLIIFNFVIHSFRIGLSLIAWMINQDPNSREIFENLSDGIIHSSLYQLAFVSTLLFKIIALILIFLKNKKKKTLFLEKVLKIKSQIEQEYKQIDIAITAFLFAISWQPNTLLLALSMVLEAYDLVFVQNYINRKSMTYICNFHSYFIYRALVFFIIGVNAFNINLQSSFVFSISFLALTTVVCAWFFFMANLRISKTQSINKLFMFQVSIYIGISFSIIQNALGSSIDVLTISSLWKFGLITTVFIIFCEIVKESHRLKIFNTFPSGEKIKEYDLLLTSTFEKVSDNTEQTLMLSGIISYNFLIPDFLNASSSKQSDIHLDKAPNNQTYKLNKAKIHLQQLYEQQLQICQQKHTLFNYCELLYNEHGNINRLIFLINRLGNMSLNLFQTIMLLKYRILVKKAFLKLNENLYENTVNFDHIIECQGRIESLQSKVMIYLSKYKHIWNLFGEASVEMQSVRQYFQQNLKTTKELDEEWRSIMPYFEFNKAWKRMHFNYLLFIKNKKIKQKLINELEKSEKSVSNSMTLTNLQGHSTRQVFNPAILFKKNIAYIKAVYRDKELFVKSVNQRFEILTNIKNDQISDCNLQAIIPKDLRVQHKQVVNEWMDRGYILKDSKYEVKHSDLIGKQGAVFPVSKFFNTYYSIEEGLLFVCLLQFQKQEAESRTTTQKSLKSYEKIASRNILTQANQAFDSKDSRKLPQMYESNIFIKEQSMECSKTNNQIQRFLYLGRVSHAITILLVIVALVTLKANSNGLLDHSNQFVNQMYIYRYPILLNINYMKSFLKIGNQSSVSSTIKINTNKLIAAASNNLTIQTLFDSELNKPQIYYPDTSYFPQFADASYNQIDLFYVILSSVSSLATFPIDRTSKKYKEFVTFMKPSYDTMINGTKNALHENFSTLIQNTNDVQIQMIVIEVIIFVLLLAIMIAQLLKFFRKRMALTSIIKDFSEEHYKMIKRYHSDLKRHFEIVFNRQDEFALTQASFEPVNQAPHQKNNLNKKQKVLFQKKSSSSKSSLIIKIVFIIAEGIIILLFIAAASVNLEQIAELNLLEENGFYFLRYFPTSPLTTMGVIEKYYSVLYPNEKSFDPKKYEDVIASIGLFGNFPYIGSLTTQNSYFEKQKKYFFGNPCTYNPSILITSGLTVAECLTISNGTFQEGVSSYMRYSQKFASDYIYGRTNLTQQQVDEYTRSVNYQTVFVLDAISTWIVEFIQSIQKLQSTNKTMGIVIILSILAIHFILYELIIRSMLNREYQIVRQIYQYFVPEFLLQQDKVIRQKFIIEGLIKRE